MRTSVGLLILLATSVASAQGTGAGPTMGPGTTGGGTGAPGSTGGPTSVLDLPVAPPSLDRPFTPPEEPEGEDPRDTAAPTIYGEEIDSENDTIMYVIDVSGSMRNGRQSYVNQDAQVSSGTRLDRAKAELAKSIMGLSSNFSFNVISYECSTKQWKDSLQEASDANKSAAVAWVMSQSARGGTGTGPATALSLNDKNNMAVVLLTDGSPNCGASGTTGHRSMISTSNTQGAVINVFGISATGTWRAFCQGVAGDSGGSYFDVPSGQLLGVLRPAP